jgi:hypothetical protein
MLIVLFCAPAAGIPVNQPAPALPRFLPPQTARLQESVNGIQTLYGEYKSRGNDFRFCLEGCQVPFNGTADPFIEFTEYGFRGFPSGESACGSYYLTRLDLFLKDGGVWVGV